MEPEGKPTPVLGMIIPLLPAGGDLEKTVRFYEAELGFETLHRDYSMAIVRRDSAHLMLYRNGDKHLADNTAIRIQVTNVAQLYDEIMRRGGEMVHPDGSLARKPWGTEEFTVIDPAGVCIAFYEFSEG